MEIALSADLLAAVTDLARNTAATMRIFAFDVDAITRASNSPDTLRIVVLVV